MNRCTDKSIQRQRKFYAYGYYKQSLYLEIYDTASSIKMWETIDLIHLPVFSIGLWFTVDKWSIIVDWACQSKLRNKLLFLSLLYMSKCTLKQNDVYLSGIFVSSTSTGNSSIENRGSCFCFLANKMKRSSKCLAWFVARFPCICTYLEWLIFFQCKDQDLASNNELSTFCN